jgi:hypothetical protein
MTAIDVTDALRRMQVEFAEMPTLKLTRRQACRLWSLPDDVCDAALGCLVQCGFLEHTDGIYLRRGLGRKRKALRQQAA